MGERKRLAIEIVGRMALVAGSILFTLVFLELGCRLWRGPDWLFHWPNFAWEKLQDAKDWPVCSHVHDPHLGWTAKPNYESALFNVGPDGYRVTGPLPPGADGQQVVLATGDSFTEGDEVDDVETWPAHLQGLLGRRVINAGVSGFGIDQIVMRTEEAAAKVRPALVVVAFIPDDVRRNEFSRLWSVQKPYFVLQEDKLSLRNHPVPPPSAACDSLPFWQHVIGRSALVDGIARRLHWRDLWFSESNRALPEGDGERLVCPLMQRLSRLEIPILVVAQFDRYIWQQDDKNAARQLALSRSVLDCATAAGLATLDLFDVVERTIRSRGIDAIYMSGHHSGEGNRVVAQAIANRLSRGH